MKTVKELNEILCDLTEEGQALQNVAESGELNEDQQARWKSLLDDESGEITAVSNQLQAAKQYEGEKKKLATLRLMQEGPIENPLHGTEWDQQTGSIDMRDPALKRLANIARPTRAFKNTAEGKRDALNCGMWLRAMIGMASGRMDRQAEQHIDRLGWQMTATEGTGSAGGYTVPDPLEAAFIEYRESVGIGRQLAERHAMSSDTLSIPKLLTGPTVYYPGEATAGTASDQTWGQVSLSAVKRMVLSKVSNELAADSLINVMDQLVARTAYEMALQEDKEFILGDGTATYGGETGLLSAIGAAGVETGTTTTYDTWVELVLANFTDTMAILPDKHRGDPSWICSSAFYYGVLLKLIAAAGGNTVATLEAGGATRPLFLGFPVYFSGNMPTTTAVSTKSILFGTFREAVVLGERQGIQMGMSADRYFDEDVTAVRTIERIDWNVHNGGDGSNAGAYVAFSTGAAS